MTISSVECSAVCQELNQTLVGGAIQKIHQPQPWVLTLDVRMPGVSLNLLVCVEPKFARLHLISTKFKNPLTPLPFCQYLRSHLEGGRIESIDQEPGDRIVYFNIVKATNNFMLVVALTGNQANVLVLNEARVILQSLKPSRLEVGHVYRVPGRPTTIMEPPPLPFPVSEKTVMQGLKEGGSFANRFPVSADLEVRYQEELESLARLEWFKVRTTKVRKALKQSRRREQTLEADLAKSEKYKEYQRYGELLKSQLHALKPRQASVELVDYYDPALPTLTLPLNELKDPVWNMEDYFRKYRKYLSAQEHHLPRLEQTRKNIESYKEELTELEKAELNALVESPVSKSATHPVTSSAHTTNAFTNVKAKGRYPSMQSDNKSLAMDKRQKSNLQTKHYRTFESFDGLTILVGKSAKDNDYLTLKVAKPNDLWLHARGCPGSHVVVRLDKATDVPHETLRDAATLALFYSDLKKSGKGEVIYTLRKFVKKSKGLKAGAVHVTREKSVWIEIKKDRLDRLKGGS